jgi:hypothetical protein
MSSVLIRGTNIDRLNPLKYENIKVRKDSRKAVKREIIRIPGTRLISGGIEHNFIRRFPSFASSSF